MPATESRFLLDTNVVSETAKSAPTQGVITWLATQRSLSISSVTLFEVSAGIQRLRSGRRRRFLEAWLAELLTEAIDVLAFDQAAALAASRLEARGRAAGRPIELRDLFILATADAAGLTVATRNTDHFAGFGVPVFDPFTDIATL